MGDVVVVVPMLGRPWAIQPLLASLQASDPDGRARALFVVSKVDGHVLAEADRQNAEVLVHEPDIGPGDYARKINAGAAATDEEWVFTAASDITFRPGWIPQAIDAWGDRYAVVGTNDLGNSLVKRGQHSTHTFVRRDYIADAVIDEPGAIYSTAYQHNYVDMELVDYAKWNGQFVCARRSIVEHHHPDWRKAESDATYRLGKQGFRDDQKLYHERSKLWRGDTPEEQRRRARARLRPDAYRIR